ncbi:MAG TPA: ABC transporter permease [Pseudogracilibacillus sp.]|nr:ABC transporter permease [Pseudogracilibacillus sp.]
MKPIHLFLEQHVKKAGRKWYALPLLLLFPVLIIGLLALVAVTFLNQEDEEAIKIGLVDQDESEETEMVSDLLSDTEELGSLLEITPMSEEEAEENIKNNELVSYIVFPEGFTNDLYNGNATEISLIGNPNQPTNSYIVKELIDSVSRHIRAAQANILTMNKYAKDLPMTDGQRNQFVFGQFKDFLLYTMSRDQMVKEHEVTNQATEAPVYYFMLGGWFVVVTIWLLGFYTFFTDERTSGMKQRMRLYGVRDIQLICAKIISTFMLAGVFTAALLWLFQIIDIVELYVEDVGRIISLMSMYNFSFLACLALIETIVHAPKIKLLVQCCFTFIVLLLSGAIIPVLYYPSYIQQLLPYSFSTQAFHWVKEVVLNDRFFAEMLPLGVMMFVSLATLLAVSWLKERVRT